MEYILVLPCHQGLRRMRICAIGLNRKRLNGSEWEIISKLYLIPFSFRLGVSDLNGNSF